MKKLRLILFEECIRNCEGCCNKDWHLDTLEKETLFTGYDEIMLTGGEPMLRPLLVMDTAINIREKTKAKIYMYTAKIDNYYKILAVLHYIDGITVTLHEQTDADDFIYLNGILSRYKLNKSFRLNVFKGIDISSMNTSNWKVKSEIEWIYKCPLPKNEILKKL